MAITFTKDNQKNHYIMKIYWNHESSDYILQNKPKKVHEVEEQPFSLEEYNRYISTKKMPLTTTYGNKLYIDEECHYHRLDGPAIICPNYIMYFIHGEKLSEVEWLKIIQKRVYFLREKIKLLQKLTEIPELFQEVYYAHKNSFTTLLRKIG